MQIFRKFLKNQIFSLWSNCLRKNVLQIESMWKHELFQVLIKGLNRGEIYLRNIFYILDSNQSYSVECIWYQRDAASLICSEDIRKAFTASRKLKLFQTPTESIKIVLKFVISQEKSVKALWPAERKMSLVSLIWNWFMSNKIMFPTR